MVKLLQDALDEGVRHRFERALATSREQDKDVASGREVEAYVDFTHYVERLHSAIEAAGGAAHHE